jgi:hypothetical protein
MADIKKDLTVYQKLTQVFGFPNEKRQRTTAICTKSKF